MKQFWKEKWNVVLYFVLVGIVIFMVLRHTNSGYDESFVMMEETDISQGWIYSFNDGSRGITALPANLDYNGGDTLYLTNFLPEITAKQSLFFRARHTAVRIFIDGELRYDSISGRTDEDYWYDMVGISYNEISLYPEDSGKHIVIQSKSPMERYIKNPGSVYLGDRGTFFLNLLNDHKATVLCAIILTFLSIILLALWFVNTVLLKNVVKEFLCLALFSFSVAAWLITESDCAQFVMGDSGKLSILAVEILMLIPVPIALYFVYYSDEKWVHIVARIAATVPLVLFLINNSLHFMKIASLAQTLIITQTLLGIELVVVSAIQIHELYYKSRVTDFSNTYTWTIPLFGVVMLVPMALTEVVKYAFFSTKYKNDGILISTGVCIYLCSLACDSIVRMRHRSERYRENSEIKTQFLANMSHEIRTPLNAILGFNEVILRKSKEEAIRGYAHEIQSAGNNLKGIINSILDISKIESGKLEIYSVEYNVVTMLDGIVSMFETLATKKGLIVLTDIDEKIPISLIGDENHITQIITNIMSNAVKYTERGSVTLKVELLEMPEDMPTCKLKVSVKDTGIGIKEEDLSKLSEKFSRFDREKNYSVEGTGLGMSIVVQLLKAMNTEMKVDSVYGEGSTFSFEIDQSVVDHTPMGSFTERRKNNAKEGQETYDFIAPDASILIVDDVQMNLDTAKALLEQYEVKIDTALSGKEALEKVQVKRYDMVLMDHMMPGMDGVQTTEAIRNLAVEYENVYYACIPIIALTANAVVGMKEHFLQAGMQDFVSKPIEVDVLHEAIKKWLPKDKIVQVTKKEEPVKDEKAAEDDGWGQVPEGFEKAVAKTYCPTYDLFSRNIKTYANNCNSTCDKLLAYKRVGDGNNYMIIVHGLKSTSKMIGRVDISEIALAHEMHCKNGEPELAFEDTENLLEIYKKCCREIKAFLGEEETEPETSCGMSEDDYSALMKRIKEAAENFDMATFMDLEDELSNITPPDSRKEQFEKVKELVSNTEFGDVEELLSEF